MTREQLRLPGPPGLYSSVGRIWDGGGFSGTPSSALLLDATLRSPEYLCRGRAGSVPPRPEPRRLRPPTPLPSIHLRPELTGPPAVPRPSWRLHCCRREADPCRPRPHRHSHAPCSTSRAPAPAAAPACRAPCPAAWATRASAPPGSPAPEAGLGLPAPLSSPRTSCCSHRAEICGGAWRSWWGCRGLCPPFPAAPCAPPRTRWHRSSRRWPRPLSAPAPGWASGRAAPADPGTRALGTSAPDTRGLRPQRVPGRTGVGAAGPPGQGAGVAGPSGHGADRSHGAARPGGASGVASPPWSCGSGRPTAGFPGSWGSPSWPPAEKGAPELLAPSGPLGRSRLAVGEGRL